MPAQQSESDGQVSNEDQRDQLNGEFGVSLPAKTTLPVSFLAHAEILNLQSRCFHVSASQR